MPSDDVWLSKLGRTATRPRRKFDCDLLRRNGLNREEIYVIKATSRKHVTKRLLVDEAIGTGVELRGHANRNLPEEETSVRLSHALTNRGVRATRYPQAVFERRDIDV